MLVSTGTTTVLKSYIVTLVEYIISEDSKVVTVLKVAIAAIVAIITILIRKVLITLTVGRRAKF